MQSLGSSFPGRAKIRRIISNYALSFYIAVIMSRIERKYCLIGVSYLAGLFENFKLLDI